MREGHLVTDRVVRDRHVGVGTGRSAHSLDGRIRVADEQRRAAIRPSETTTRLVAVADHLSGRGRLVADGDLGRDRSSGVRHHHSRNDNLDARTLGRNEVGGGGVGEVDRGRAALRVSGAEEHYLLAERVGDRPVHVTVRDGGRVRRPVPPHPASGYPCQMPQRPR